METPAKAKRTPKVPPQQLEQMGFPGLSGKPVAQGLVDLTVQSGTQRTQAYYQFPVWKDEALTREWREKHGKSAPAAESDSPRRIETNPAKFEQTLRDFLSLKADSRSPFRVMIYSGIVSDQKDEDAKENEDEN